MAQLGRKKLLDANYYRVLRPNGAKIFLNFNQLINFYSTNKK